MNLIALQKRLRERVRVAAADKFGVELEQVSAEVPPRTELGDLAFPVAFELAKRLKQATGEKRNPRAIAEELRRELESSQEVARVEVAGAGYLNLFFDRGRLLAGLGAEERPEPPTVADAERPKRMVEHTSVNPNKAAHIGHLRNSVIGDTFVRILRAQGERVEVHNYIDNTGVQVADVVVGFVHLEGMSLEDVRALDTSLPPEKPFDYYCWDLYARVGLFYRGGDPDGKEDPERLRLRVETLHALEEGTSETAALADYVATRVVNQHLDTMSRLGIRYDLLPRESEVLHFLWQHAFGRMKESGALRLESERRNRGCWSCRWKRTKAAKSTRPTRSSSARTGRSLIRARHRVSALEARTVDLNFNFKPFRTYADGHVVWTTTNAPDASGATPAPGFGGGARVYNVIDSRQSYPQEVVKRGVAAVAPEVGEDASVHLSYEMVALSPAAAEELGIELSAEERARPFIEMSGRRGLGVKADDLIDRLEENALKEVEARHAQLSDEERRNIAHVIAVGALRYFLLKWTRNSVIVFDFQEALSFEGETGPYCQYAAVRANSIFRKLDAQTLEGALEFVSRATQSEGGGPEVVDEKIAHRASEIRAVFEGEGGDEIWSLMMQAARFEEALRQSAAQNEPAHLAKYAFQLARAFNLFYHRHHIIGEEMEAKRAVLIAITNFVRRQLIAALDTLGIEVPDRM